MLFIAFISQKVWYLIYTLLSKNLFKIINSHALKTKKKNTPLKTIKLSTHFLIATIFIKITDIIYDLTTDELSPVPLETTAEQRNKNKKKSQQTKTLPKARDKEITRKEYVQATMYCS